MTRTDNTMAMMFHIFLCDKTSYSVKQYLDTFVDTGIYDKCDIILVRIRYADSLKLDETLKLLNTYKKVHIISVDDNDSGYYGASKQYFYMEPKPWKKPQACKLGEVESIIEMMCNPAIRDILVKYDTCVFCHTKSASIGTKYNTRNDPRNTFEYQIDWHSIWLTRIDDIIKNDRVISSEKFSNGKRNNFFVFNTNCIDRFCINNYLSDYANSPKLLEKNYPHWKEHKLFNITTDGVTFTNRHAFCYFNQVMNHLYLDEQEYRVT